MRHLLSSVSILLIGITVLSNAFAKQDDKPKPILKIRSEEGKKAGRIKKPFKNHPILSIEFRGNESFSADRLRDFMESQKVGEVYEKEKLERELDRLRLILYADEGYLKAQFGTPEIADTPDGLRITVPVLEGFRYRVGDIKIENAKFLLPDEVLRRIDLKKGDIVKGYIGVENGLKQLKQYYLDHGYINFNVSFDPDFLDGSIESKEATIDITFDFDEGEKFSIGKIEFKSKTAIDESYLRSILPIHEGDIYNRSLVEECFERINRLGLFEELDLAEDIEHHANETTRQVDFIFHLRKKQKQ